MRIYKISGWMNLFYAKLAKVMNYPAVYPLVLMIVGLAAYGTLIYHSGFYWDDWESVYLYFLHKPNISFHYFGERPFSTLVYLVLFPLFQMKPLTWFLISLFLRWAGVLGIYYAMNSVWPKRLYQNRWIGLLLFVFPAFLQQPLSLCYSRHFSAFALFGLSLLFTVTAIKSPKRFWVWMISSIFLGLLQIFIIEYFVGLEILRPLFIWYALRSKTHEGKKTTLWKTVVLWSPFILGLIVYFVWHFYYLPNFNGGMNPNNPVLIRSLIDTPGKTIIALLKHAAQDFWHTLFAVWANGFSADKFSFIHSKIAIIAWSLALPTSILAGFYIKAAGKEKDIRREDHFGQMLLLGLLAFAGGGIPYWVTNRQINVGNWSDRFALAPMIGAAILIVSVIDWLIRTINQKQAFLIFLLLVSIVIQIFNANVFRQDWLLQSNLYWQLAWRIPALKPGTAIIGKGTFTPKSSYYDGVYIINLLFDQQVKPNPSYGYFDAFHIDRSSLSSDQIIINNLRSGEFIGNTSEAVAMYFDWEGGCIRLVDNLYRDDPNYGEEFMDILPLSNLSQVTLSDSQIQPDPSIFGPEPVHGWCFYFEKADLARQFQDWGTIIQLNSEIESQGLEPVHGIEYLPFIEAFAQSGDWSKAFTISKSAYWLTPEIGPALCKNWNKYASVNTYAAGVSFTSEAKDLFCKTIEQ